MTRSTCLAILVSLSAVVSLSFGQTADLTAGKAAYTKRCATCHDASGGGKEPLAKMLKIEFRHLGSKEVQALSDADLRKIIREGKGKMKGIKEVSDQEMPNLLGYLRTLAQK